MKFRLNEADARSVTSKVSASSSSSSANQNGTQKDSNNHNSTTASSSQDNSNSNNNNIRKSSSTEQSPAAVAAEDDDENIDLWTVWGNLIKSWECEMKKRPNCIKVTFNLGKIMQHNYEKKIHWKTSQDFGGIGHFSENDLNGKI